MRPFVETRAVLIAGPTASGKSALALALAKRCNGVIINADSMQIYADLAILTARPNPAEQDGIDHRLFGMRDAADPCSAAEWHAMAMREIEDVWRQGRLPILVGGTGLYFKALIEGLAPVPEIPESVRGGVRAELAEHGPAILHDELARGDRETAERLSRTDSQRIARAVEVLRATGRPLSAFQRETEPGGLAAADAEGRLVKAVLDLPRATLNQRADERFDKMLEQGALEEVARLAERGLDSELPAMKALGVPALLRYQRGALSYEAAVDGAKRQTRRYVKRQQTWMATQFPDWLRLGSTDCAAALAELERSLDAVNDKER